MQNLDELDQDPLDTMVDWMTGQHCLTLRKFFGLWVMMYDDAYSVKVIFNTWKLQANPFVNRALIMNTWYPRPSTNAASSSF